MKRVGKYLEQISGENRVFRDEISCIEDRVLKKELLALSWLKAGVYSLMSCDWSPRPVFMLSGCLLPILLIYAIVYLWWEYHLSLDFESYAISLFRSYMANPILSMFCL